MTLATETTSLAPNTAGWRAIGALSYAHGANDMYMGFLPALLPLIVINLGLDYKSAGLLVSLVTITSQFSQPIFGFLGDRLGGRLSAIFAPVLTGICFSLLGLAPNFSLLLALLLVGSIGNSAFHPQGAGLVGRVARRPDFAMAAFTTGGSLGYGVGSLLIAYLVSSLGMMRTWITMPFGFLSALLVTFTISPTLSSLSRRKVNSSLATSSPWLLPFVFLFLVVMLRAATATVFTTFVPLLISRRGETLMLGGWALLGFSLSGAMGGLLGGWLAEGLGRRAVTVVSLTLTAPALYFFLQSSGLLSAVLLFLTGACLMSALPVNIMMGQHLFPGRVSTISGITMGVAWGVGGLAAAAVGALADRWAVSLGELAGLSAALSLTPLIPLLAAAFALALPGKTINSRKVISEL